MDNGTTFRSADHDMIVGLNVKVDRVITDIKEIKDDNNIRIAKLETRVDEIDTYHARIDMAHFEANSMWVDKFRANYGLILTFGTIVVALISAVLTELIKRFFGL